jgi:hypothetical protein
MAGHIAFHNTHGRLQAVWSYSGSNSFLSAVRPFDVVREADDFRVGFEALQDRLETLWSKNRRIICAEGLVGEDRVRAWSWKGGDLPRHRSVGRSRKVRTSSRGKHRSERQATVWMIAATVAGAPRNQSKPL